MIDRRKFLSLAAAGGGVVFLSGLYGPSGASSSNADKEGAGKEDTKKVDDFYFVQMSDSHWGFSGPPNPEAATTLIKAVDAVNALDQPPDFIVFTGDLTHTTDDPKERRQRMAEFKDIVSRLKVKPVYFMPGEHDAALDNGSAFKEYFGATHYSFDYKGIHFIAIDNVSLPGSRIGDEQLGWLKSDLAGQRPDQRLVIFTHRPLFDLVPKWDWATRDGNKAMELLTPFEHVVVFYGHIHQEHHHQTGHIMHHAAKSLIFPLPAPGSQEFRTPLPWNPALPFAGLGVREVNVANTGLKYDLNEYPI